MSDVNVTRIHPLVELSSLIGLILVFISGLIWTNANENTTTEIATILCFWFGFASLLMYAITVAQWSNNILEMYHLKRLKKTKE